MKYSNVVINLVGRNYETRNFSFDKVNVEGAARIARIAKEMGVQHFMHFSHLNANPNPTSFIANGSNFLRSKYHGELAVREAFPEATIFRPSDIYGDEDMYLNIYASKARRCLDYIPICGKGEDIYKSPVYVQDVAKGVINAIYDPESIGKTYEINNEKSYYLSELVDFYLRCMREDKLARCNMNPLYKLKCKLFTHTTTIGERPSISVDKTEAEHLCDEVTGLPNLSDLGVKQTNFETQVLWQLKPFRKHQYYEDRLGEIPDPAPPQPIVSRVF